MLKTRKIIRNPACILFVIEPACRRRDGLSSGSRWLIIFFHVQESQGIFIPAQSLPFNEQAFWVVLSGAGRLVSEHLLLKSNLSSVTSSPIVLGSVTEPARCPLIVQNLIKHDKNESWHAQTTYISLVLWPDDGFALIKRTMHSLTFGSSMKIVLSSLRGTIKRSLEWLRSHFRLSFVAWKCVN